MFMLPLTTSEPTETIIVRDHGHGRHVWELRLRTVLKGIQIALGGDNVMVIRDNTRLNN